MRPVDHHGADAGRESDTVPEAPPSLNCLPERIQVGQPGTAGSSVSSRRRGGLLPVVSTVTPSGVRTTRRKRCERGPFADQRMASAPVESGRKSGSSVNANGAQRDSTKGGHRGSSSVSGPTNATATVRTENPVAPSGPRSGGKLRRATSTQAESSSSGTERTTLVDRTAPLESTRASTSTVPERRTIRASRGTPSASSSSAAAEAATATVTATQARARAGAAKGRERRAARMPRPSSRKAMGGASVSGGGRQRPDRVAVGKDDLGGILEQLEVARARRE